MTDESSSFDKNDNADIHGDVVVLPSLSGFIKRPKPEPVRDIDERIVAAARLVN